MPLQPFAVASGRRTDRILHDARLGDRVALRAPLPACKNAPMDETKITAKLPHLDVEITRRELAEENAETITLRMTAVPSFDAVADHLTKQGPFPLGPLGGVMMMNPWMQLWASPLLAWARMSQLAWTPWLPPPTPGRDDAGDGRAE